MLLQEAEDSGDTPAAAADTILEALLKAGIHLSMAGSLSKTPNTRGDYQSINTLKEYLIAWAMLLAHLLEMPATDLGKPFLAQALRAEHK